MNLIEDCNPIWGSVIIGTMFLPITIFLAVVFVEQLFFIKRSLCNRVWMILLLPLYGPIVIVLATPAYIIYVAYVFARRVVEPSYVSKHMDDWALRNIFVRGNRYAQAADFLKLLEAIFEANLQAITGAGSQYIHDYQEIIHSYANQIILF